MEVIASGRVLPCCAKKYRTAALGRELTRSEIFSSTRSLCYRRMSRSPNFCRRHVRVKHKTLSRYVEVREDCGIKDRHGKRSGVCSFCDPNGNSLLPLKRAEFYSVTCCDVSLARSLFRASVGALFFVRVEVDPGAAWAAAVRLGFRGARECGGCASLPPVAATACRARRPCTRTPPLDLRRSGHMQCTSVPPLAVPARSDSATSRKLDFLESACCASAVDVSRPFGRSCGGAVCSALCEDHTSIRSGSPTRSAAFVLADDASRERRDGAVAFLTSGGAEDR